MENENDILYEITTQDTNTEEKKEPKVLAVLSLVFGIASIILSGVVGIILGALARKWAGAILSDLKNAACAKFAKAGRITGTVGIAVSVLSLVVMTVICIIVGYVIYKALMGKAIF